MSSYGFSSKPGHCGGTFDQWAGDVRSFPVEIRNEDEVWVDVSSMPSRGVNCYEMLLQNGLKQNIQLIIVIYPGSVCLTY
jgi:hypothetical protein